MKHCNRQMASVFAANAPAKTRISAAISPKHFAIQHTVSGLSEQRMRKAPPDRNAIVQLTGTR
jgi:hypothetical protein